MDSYHHAGADYPPPLDSALVRLLHNQRCVVVLLTGEMREALWCRNTNRFYSLSGTASLLPHREFEEWWPISAT